MSNKNEAEDPIANVNTRPRKNTKMTEAVKPQDSSTVSPPFAPMPIKIPPFWPEKPAIWFAQVEGQFAISRIEDQATKFYLILGNLDRQHAAEVEDILTGPPDYNKLKAELIKRLSVSRENKVKQLLMHEELGSRKPSQFLRHLQHLAGPKVPEDFLKTIWSSRLPSSMQPIVASQTTLTMDALAELADRVHDIAPQVHQVTAAPSPSPIEELTRQVAELTKQVSALTSSSNDRGRRQERHYGQQRNRSSSRRSNSNYRKFPVCWYHHKFSTQARKCQKPCNFKPGNATGNL